MVFRGFKGKKLYSVVSVVWGYCEVIMRYINGFDRKCGLLSEGRLGVFGGRLFVFGGVGEGGFVF